MKSFKHFFAITLLSIIPIANAAKVRTINSGEIYKNTEKEVLTFIFEGTAVDLDQVGDSSVGKCSVMINGIEEYYFSITPVRLGNGGQWSLAGTYYAGLRPALLGDNDNNDDELPVMSPPARIGMGEPEPEQKEGYEIILKPQVYNSADHTFKPMYITDAKITVIAWEENAPLEQQIADLKTELTNYINGQDSLIIQAIDNQITTLETQLKIINDRLTALENAPTIDNDDEQRSWGEMAVLPTAAFLGSWAVTNQYDKSAAKRLSKHEDNYHRKDTANGRPPKIKTGKPVKSKQ